MGIQTQVLGLWNPCFWEPGGRVDITRGPVWLSLDSQPPHCFSERPAPSRVTYTHIKKGGPCPGVSTWASLFHTPLGTGPGSIDAGQQAGVARPGFPGWLPGLRPLPPKLPLPRASFDSHFSRLGPRTGVTPSSPSSET